MKCPNCAIVDMLKVGRFFECDECGHVIERKIKSTFNMEYMSELTSNSYNALFLNTFPEEFNQEYPQPIE